jgi:aryl-alcohol dehydrogenase-like predicted oxidoreductase
MYPARSHDAFREFATKKGVTSSQLTLAWVLAQGKDFFAIPDTKKEKYLVENHGAVNVTISEWRCSAL